MHTEVVSSRAGAEARRILVVEDDLEIQEALTSLLEGEGYEVWTSGDGREALNRLRQDTADLIILDLMLPVMNGWQFRHAQRNDPALSSIPVIAVSADASAQASTIHAEHYLRKPFKAEELLLSVERILLQQERQRLSQRLRSAERMALLGTVAAGMGHEINNPLTYVLGNLQMLDEDLAALVAEPDPDRRAELLPGVKSLLDDARLGSERIRAVVDGLRRLSRPKPEPGGAVDLPRVLETSIDIAWNEIRHRARLVRNIGEVGPLRGDEARLGQVFVNLLVNAAQAIQAGSAESNEIVISAEKRGKEVIVSVSDTGQGIDAQVQARIFEPFFTTKSAGQGTGLGLAISRNIVIEHGGRIELESPPTGGAVFRVVLPAGAAVPEDVEAEARRVLGEAGGGRRLRVLIVDDDPLVVSALKRLLGRQHQVTAVRSGEAGLEALAAATFDVILCDLMMPEMSGMTFHAELLRRAPEQCSRIVFMTGGAFAAETRAFLGSVPNRCLEKPFATETLDAALAEVAALTAHH
jgi:signal transduction histidine kinase/BarA-like signal transduction histidine kinase